jgi:serine/threonine-protein phosphatase CPPED1
MPFNGCACMSGVVWVVQDAFAGLDADIPLLCVCGNHDVGNAPSHVTVERYVSEFGDDYFGFWVGGVRGIVINSNLYYDPSQVRCVRRPRPV